MDLFFVPSGFLIGTGCSTDKRRAVVGYGLLLAAGVSHPAGVLGGVRLIICCGPRFSEARPAMEPWWKFFSFTVNLGIDAAEHRGISCTPGRCALGSTSTGLFPLLAVWLMRRPAAWKFSRAGGVSGPLGIALRSAAWRTTQRSIRRWTVATGSSKASTHLGAADGLLCGVAPRRKTLRPGTGRAQPTPTRKPVRRTWW